MSGQYPGGYNNPLGQRNQFSMQQQQQMMGANVMPMGSYPQGGMIGQQQNQMLNVPNMGQGAMGMMNPAALQTSPHLQQQQMMPQQAPQFQMQQHMPNPPVNNPAGCNMMPQQHLQPSSSNMNAPPQGPVHPGAGNPPVPSNSMLTIAPANPHKEINIVMLSRIGQETVQDITSRFQEIFSALKIIQPMANRDNNTEKKVQEYFRTIRLLFKRVRIIYEKCNEGYPQGMEYTNVESLIPFKDETDHRMEPTQCEEYRKALQENQELIETVKLKNRQLREIIDRTRIIIWEINTMLSMRRS